MTEDYWSKADHDKYAEAQEYVARTIKEDLRREIQIMISSSENRLRLTIFAAVFANIVLNQFADPLKATAAALAGGVFAATAKLILILIGVHQNG